MQSASSHRVAEICLFFIPVTEMLLHLLCSSLYLTLAFYHSLIGKLNIFGDLNWKPMRNKWVCRPYLVFFPFLKHFTRDSTALMAVLWGRSAGCCWNGCVQHRAAPGPGTLLLPLQTSPHLPPNLDKFTQYRWVKCCMLGTHTQAEHDKSTSGTKPKVT